MTAATMATRKDEKKTYLESKTYIQQTPRKWFFKLKYCKLKVIADFGHVYKVNELMLFKFCIEKIIYEKKSIIDDAQKLCLIFTLVELYSFYVYTYKFKT